MGALIMDRISMVNRIGKTYNTSNIEGGEYSYVQEAGSKPALVKAVGHQINHFKLDLRFESKDVAVLVETKQSFVKKDEKQLREYVEEEKALHPGKKIIGILANTNDDKLMVWKSEIDDAHLLENETVMDTMEHYVKLFDTARQNDREKVLNNTYDLNELLHKKDIDERLRSQFVGTTLLYIKETVKKIGAPKVDDALVTQLKTMWGMMSADMIRAGIESTLKELLDGSTNKSQKIELLQKNVLDDQKVKRLTKENWIEILSTILTDIYKYIDADSSEGQDILNLFFIAFNKYTGKADKNQAFTPDHITDFMCRLTGVDRTKVVLDPCCGSGSFLVQAMVKELANCHKGKTEAEAQELMEVVKKSKIYGIEIEEKAYGLSTTNMLIHGDGNSNVLLGDCFQNSAFIEQANPDIILMNPPYNAKPIGIPDEYKKKWGKNAANGKEDATKGIVFIQFLSDVLRGINEQKEANNEPRKTIKLAVLLPVSAAIGTSTIITEAKKYMLEENRLEAVFTLPDEIFYPGASVNACCMLFTLGKPHTNPDGTIDETFFGYYKEDGFKKKKKIGRVEQFDSLGVSKWRVIEDTWLKLFRNKKSVDGLSATAVVDGNSEWLCEAYMKTDYSKLTSEDFKRLINAHIAHQVMEGNYPNIVCSGASELPLNTTQWEEFRVSSILIIKNGKGITKEEIEENCGDFTVVQSGEINNGVLGKISLDYCKSIGYTYSEEPCLTVARTGSAGYVSFQKNGCVVGDSAKILLLDDDIADLRVYLFIQTVLTANRFKYAYGRKVTEDKYMNDIVKLPIRRNTDGSPIIDPQKRFSNKGFTPDWDFMKDYISSLPYGDQII